jgi:hypothetical protein
MSFVPTGNRIAFVQAVAASQAGSAALAAPYFEFESANDRWHKLNLRLIDDTRPLAGGRPLVTFVQAPLSSLLQGEIATAAGSYAMHGVDRVFLRVAGFDPEVAGRTEIDAYRRALDVFTSEGVDAVADCVGRFGLVAVAVGAAGFSSGARHFQRIPEDVTYDTDNMRSEPCLYEVPKRWFAMFPREARKTAHLLPLCSVIGCSALAPAAEPRDQKAHLIHYFTEEVRVYEQGGAAAARAAGELQFVGLAEALELTLLLADGRDAKYERAALRWHARFVCETRNVDIRESVAVLALLTAIPANRLGAAAMAELLSRRRSLERCAEALVRWARKA